MPVYAGDEPKYVSKSLKSLHEQSCTPAEVLIIVDGAVPESLEQVLSDWKHDSDLPIRLHCIPTNQGLGNALREGVTEATHEIVARMDADDISVESRFEDELSFLMSNPDVDIVGGEILEFNEEYTDPLTMRTVPTTHSKIVDEARFKSPMNHATVMFRRESVLDAGNYRPVDRMEDYDLWIRMILNDATFANLPQILLHVRAGGDFFARRGGIEYAREEFNRQTEFYRRGFIGLPRYVFNISTRLPFRLVPDPVREFIYYRFARTNQNQP
ncbi:glycosyltransferase [Halobacterium salinarum]|nr:glycosyltransferase [Halobacterium salinarum]